MKKSNAKIAEEYEREGECKDCGHKGLVFVDNGRCDECDGDYIFCSVCKEEVWRDDKCRHVFQDSNLEWQGSGIRINEALKVPLFHLFDLMPQTFAIDLKTAIRSRRFHTWVIAPMIGSGGILEMHGMPERDGKSMFLAYGDKMMDIGGGDHADETSDGYHWLANRKTLKANRATVAWIDEYITARAALNI